MHLAEPRFPPLLQGYAVEGVDPLDDACRRAAAGALGAGDMVWSRDAQRADCALVLEPEVSLARAHQMAIVGAVALMETLGALCPPQLPVEFLWPDTLLLNGATAGRVRLAAPPIASEAVPDWLVLALSLSLRADGTGEPGETRDVTTLAEEGAADVTHTAVIEALAPRLLAWIHTWSADGFRPIREPWLFRAVGRAADITIEARTGRVLGLDDEAGLILRGADGRVASLVYRPLLMQRA
jgi:biotin-(acetyl-CoA carboxylase) ligase